MHLLGKLKDKPSKVIFMATIAGLWFVLCENFTAPLEMTYLAASILALCLGLYFLHKGGH